MIRDALTAPLMYGAQGVNVRANPPEELPGWWESLNRRKPDLTYKDQLNKNWLQKWLHHGRFPFKFIVHLLLVVACTWMVYIVGGNQASHSNRVSASWCVILLEDNCLLDDITPSPFYLYSVDDVVDVVQTALQNFEAAPTTGIGRIKVHQSLLTVDSFLNCESRYNLGETRVDQSTVQATFNVTSGDLGPLNATSNKALHYFFECLDNMALSFYVSSVHLSVDERPIEYMWIIRLVFGTEDNTGQLKVTYDTDRYPFIRDTIAEYVAQTRVILNIIIIFLGTVSQVLHWLSIIRSIKIYLQVKRKIQLRQSHASRKAPLTWKSLPFATKRRFFNMWFVLAILGSACNIVGAFIDIFYVWQQNIVSDMLTQIFIGTGTLLAWLCMTHYLEFNRQYTVLIDALVTGLPDVLRFVVGVLPVYVGFALFGYVVFSETTKRFTTFGEAFVTLFGIQNGDDMQASFRSLDAHLVVSRIYLFLFSLISIYTIANIFIAIMATAFQTSSKVLRGQQNPALTEEEKERQIWDTIMGMNTDSDNSDLDQNGPSINQRGIPDGAGSESSEEDDNNGNSSRKSFTSNINLKGKDLGDDDSDDSML